MESQNEKTSQITALDKIFNKVMGQFDCSICLNELSNTFVTKCIHRFCENCIKESINQHHKCPLCNAELTLNDLAKDTHFDSLKDDIEILKKEKMEALLQRLTYSDNDKNKTVEFSPLETVLKKHLVKSFQVYQNYTNKLKTQLEIELEKVKNKNQISLKNLDQRLENLKDFNNEKSNYLNKEADEVKRLNEYFENQILLTAKKYENYLNDIKMTPFTLPVRIHIKIMSKKLQINDFELKINHEISEVFDFIFKFSEKQNNKIIELDENLNLICTGPFKNLSFNEAQLVYDEYLSTGSLPNGIQIIKNSNCFPLLEYSIFTNSEIIIFGKVKFESDLPKRCFKYKFNKNNIKTDYFSCGDCKLNWICKCCIETCHSNHSTKVFTLNHKAEWACCYCQKHECKLKEP